MPIHSNKAGKPSGLPKLSRYLSFAVILLMCLAWPTRNCRCQDTSQHKKPPWSNPAVGLAEWPEWSFHVRFADQVWIAREDFHIPEQATRLPRPLDLDLLRRLGVGYLEPSVPEVDQMRREVEGNPDLFGGKPLLLDGLRRRMTAADSEVFSQVKRLYDFSSATQEVDYVVPLRDVKRQGYLGFAVRLSSADSQKVGLSHQFLISEPIKASDVLLRTGVPSLSPNTAEVGQMRRELEGRPDLFAGKPLILDGLRRPMTDGDSRVFAKTKALYDMEIAVEDVRYVVPLQDARGRGYLGFGVTLPENNPSSSRPKIQFLISEHFHAKT